MNAWTVRKHCELIKEVMSAIVRCEGMSSDEFTCSEIDVQGVIYKKFEDGSEGVRVIATIKITDAEHTILYENQQLDYMWEDLDKGNEWIDNTIHKYLQKKKGIEKEEYVNM